MRCFIFIPAVIYLFGLVSPAFSDTTWVNAGPVSGVWTSAGSPYIAHQGDIVVQSGDSLVILPRVTVKFTGRYKFIVNGLLIAEGTIYDSIFFSRAYPTEESKWRGFRFDGADSHTSLFYCRIEYAKGDGAYPEVRGGGINVKNGSITVRHCLLTRNYSSNANRNGGGAGICLDEHGSALIHYSVISDNEGDSGGGIMVRSDSLSLIGFNDIENNHAFSGGGGIYVGSGSQAEIYNNVFRGNSSDNWGGGAINLWSGDVSQVFNNEIHHNAATGAGGGIYCRYDGSLIYNNTIAENQAAQGGGVFVLNQGNNPPSIYNSIIWGNSAGLGADVYLYPSTGSAANISYCDIPGGWAGTGNIGADPLFVTGPDGNYYLSQIAAGQTVQSPCVDAGDPQSALLAGTTRTDRVRDSMIVDMGYHYRLRPVVTLRVTLTPTNPPVQIPAGGGSFEYTATVNNFYTAAMNFEAWTIAVLPDARVYGPIMLRQGLTLAGGGSMSRTLVQNVPGSAPPGNYTLIGRVGTFPDSVIAADGIHFVKLGGD